jgi:hypothetical protein
MAAASCTRPRLVISQEMGSQKKTKEIKKEMAARENFKAKVRTEGESEDFL